jgi:hypothetical protein
MACYHSAAARVACFSTRNDFALNFCFFVPVHFCQEDNTAFFAFVIYTHHHHHRMLLTSPSPIVHQIESGKILPCSWQRYLVYLWVQWRAQDTDDEQNNTLTVFSEQLMVWRSCMHEQQATFHSSGILHNALIFAGDDSSPGNGRQPVMPADGGTYATLGPAPIPSVP